MTPRQLLKRWIYGSCPGFAGSFPYFGTRVYFPKGSHIFNRACEEDVYEKANLRLMASLVRPESFYFDVGANIGLLSIPILRCHPTCSVLSFEPSPSTLPFLKRTAAESNFGQRWRVIEKAAGRTEGALEFFTHGGAQGGFDSLRNTGRASNAVKHSVPVTTLDTQWKAAGSPEVSLIKIDVEGAELETLNGSVDCIRAKQPNILLEWSARNLAGFDCPPTSLLDFAREYGYSLFSLPELELIQGPAQLQLKMLATEDFLLAPAQPPKGWRLHYDGFPGLRD